MSNYRTYIIKANEPDHEIELRVSVGEYYFQVRKIWPCADGIYVQPAFTFSCQTMGRLYTILLSYVVLGRDIFTDKVLRALEFRTDPELYWNKLLYNDAFTVEHDEYDTIT